MAGRRAGTGVTKQRIVEEAARLFNRRGFRGTTLDSVAAALGVTRPALYYHVKSKEELLFHCYKIPIEIALEGIRRALAASDAADEQLRLALAHYLGGMTGQLSGSVVLVEDQTLSAAHQHEIAAWRDRYDREIRDIIARGVEQGVFVPCDPKLVSFAILGAVNWVTRWYDAGGPSSGAGIADLFARYLVRGLLRSPDATPLAVSA